MKNTEVRFFNVKFDSLSCTAIHNCAIFLAYSTQPFKVGTISGRCSSIRFAFVDETITPYDLYKYRHSFIS